MADFARGQLLVGLRERRHLSQEDAAHEIGVTAKSLRAWEHGGAIRWDNAKKVAEFYDIEPERLVSRELPSDDGAEPLRADEVVVGKLDEILSRMDQLEAQLALWLPAQEAAPTDPAKEHKSRTTGSRRAKRRSSG